MISIIIPCYNYSQYIADAIMSVKSQTSDDWECIIVDDGSTDDSGSIIDKEVDGRFKVFHTANNGVAKARNFAISKARGEYILPLDADDRLMPDAIKIFSSYWDKNPSASLLVSRISREYQSGKTIIQSRKWDGYGQLLLKCSPCNSSCYKKSDWERIGGYRDGTMYEDWDFWIRLLHNNDNVINIDNVLIRYRVHEGSRLKAANRRRQEELKILKEMNSDIFYRKDKYDDKILVVIPYYAGGAQGRELEYAVAGWRRHFKENYLIVIVGDYNPVVDTGDDIVFIECERVPAQGNNNYRPHIDFVNKFKKVRAAFPDHIGFVYGSDDCYAVNDFTMADLTRITQNGDTILIHVGNVDPWYRESAKTKRLLIKEGYGTRNFVTHLPFWVEWDKLIALWDRYDMYRNSYIFEDLYFNIYYPDVVPFQLDVKTDSLKYGVYRKHPDIDKVRKALGTKIWIQNSVKGWCPELEALLSEYYGI